MPGLLKGKTFTLLNTYLYSILVVTCPPLVNPSHGNWHRDDCKANRQSCRSVCLLQCDIVNGFQLEGPNRRECLANGQWSTPWSSHCKGMRRKDMDVYLKEYFSTQCLHLIFSEVHSYTCQTRAYLHYKKRKKKTETKKIHSVSRIPYRLTRSCYGDYEETLGEVVLTLIPE